MAATTLQIHWMRFLLKEKYIILNAAVSRSLSDHFVQDISIRATLPQKNGCHYSSNTLDAFPAQREIHHTKRSSISQPVGSLRARHIDSCHTTSEKWLPLLFKYTGCVSCSKRNTSY